MGLSLFRDHILLHPDVEKKTLNGSLSLILSERYISYPLLFTVGLLWVVRVYCNLLFPCGLALVVLLLFLSWAGGPGGFAAFVFLFLLAHHLCACLFSPHVSGWMKVYVWGGFVVLFPGWDLL